MNIVSRLTIAIAFASVAAVACTTVPDEPVSVGVEADQVDTKCIKGGITCGSLGGGRTVGGDLSTSSGGTVSSGGTTSSSSGGTSGKLGATSGALTSSGVVMVEEQCGPKGCDPIDCGEYCRWNKDMSGCDCSGAGYGLSSTISCPWSHPCGRTVFGIARCYDRLASGECAP